MRPRSERVGETGGAPAQRPPEPAEAFAFLLGVWSVEREIPGQATMQGRATVRQLHDDLAESIEEVEVRTVAGARFRGVQRYRYQRSPEGLVILFAETGEIFQSLCFAPDPSGGGLIASAEHLCRADRYVSRYQLQRAADGGKLVRITHRVRGPRKHYQAATRFWSVAPVP